MKLMNSRLPASDPQQGVRPPLRRLSRVKLPSSGAAISSAKTPLQDYNVSGEANMRPIRIGVLAVALSTALGFVGGAGSTQRSTNEQHVSGTIASRRMADGREWTTANLNVNASPSHCYDDADSNCRRYGRLYTWESAQRVCQLLGDGWRLPTDDEWRQMAKRYGGVSDDSADKGTAAFTALLTGGTSGFNAVLGGNRSDGQYARVEAHGFYWTASANDSGTAPFYNFGKNGQALSRQPQGEKRMAISVRCISDR